MHTNRDWYQGPGDGTSLSLYSSIRGQGRPMTACGQVNFYKNLNRRSVSYDDISFPFYTPVNKQLKKKNKQPAEPYYTPVRKVKDSTSPGEVAAKERFEIEEDDENKTPETTTNDQLEKEHHVTGKTNRHCMASGLLPPGAKEAQETIYASLWVTKTGRGDSVKESEV